MARGRPRKTPITPTEPAAATPAAASAGPQPAAPRAKRAKRAAKRASRRAAAAVVPFPKKLVLVQWMLSLFGAERFDDLAEHLRDANLEGLGADNIHRFHEAIVPILCYNKTSMYYKVLEVY